MVSVMSRPMMNTWWRGRGRRGGQLRRSVLRSSPKIGSHKNGVFDRPGQSLRQPAHRALVFGAWSTEWRFGAQGWSARQHGPVVVNRDDERWIVEKRSDGLNDGTPLICSRPPFRLMCTHARYGRDRPRNGLVAQVRR